MVRFVVQAPRWLFLGALIFAPWAYGSTRPWTINVLLIQLAVVLALWLAGCALRRSWPVIHPVHLGLSLFLILEAWWMVWNAKYEYDPDNLKFIELSRFLNGAPGTVHKSASLEIALRITALLMVSWFVCDLAGRAIWRKRVLRTMALAGASIALLGVLQRVAHAQGIFWGEPIPGGTFFASYRYHANAGAFLNLAWPMVAALFVIGTHRALRVAWFWGAALVLCLAASFVNSSRAATLITIVLGVAWLIWLTRQHFKDRLFPEVNPANLVAIGLGIIILLCVAFVLGGLDLSWQRWAEFESQFSRQNPRLLVAGACWDMIPQAGWWGFGPGTFQTIFPYHTHDLGDAISGIWYFAHQDYLQTILEWGWAGAAGWAVLFFGSLFFAWRVQRKKSEDGSTSERVYYFAIGAALLGVGLHALGDFPLQIASLQLYVAVLAGLLWGMRNWAKTEHSGLASGARHLAGSAFGVNS